MLFSVPIEVRQDVDWNLFWSVNLGFLGVFAFLSFSLSLLIQYAICRYAIYEVDEMPRLFSLKSLGNILFITLGLTLFPYLTTITMFAVVKAGTIPVAGPIYLCFIIFRHFTSAKHPS